MNYLVCIFVTVVTRTHWVSDSVARMVEGGCLLLVTAKVERVKHVCSMLLGCSCDVRERRCFDFAAICYEHARKYRIRIRRLIDRLLANSCYWLRMTRVSSWIAS